MEFDEHEGQEEEMEDEEGEKDEVAVTAGIRQSYQQLGEGARKPTRYRECLKNHALSVGGHVVDGCGEFMAAGEEGTLDALRCAACNCHRNFHRKETENRHPQQPSQVSSHYRSPSPAGYLHLNPGANQRPVALLGGTYNSQEEEEEASNPSSSGARKRFRTKFTAEQKEKMLQFAVEVGWRIRREEAAAVERFCAEAGVSRHVLKVWMHNNKNSRGGKKP